MDGADPDGQGSARRPRFERGGVLGEVQVERTDLHERHGRKGNVLWAHGHATAETLESLGYQVREDGVVGIEGNNSSFHIDGKDDAWVRDWS